MNIIVARRAKFVCSSAAATSATQVRLKCNSSAPTPVVPVIWGIHSTAGGPRRDHGGPGRWSLSSGVYIRRRGDHGGTTGDQGCGPCHLGYTFDVGGTTEGPRGARAVVPVIWGIHSTAGDHGGTTGGHRMSCACSMSHIGINYVGFI